MRTLLLTLLTLSACGSDEEPFDDCNIGNIDGAWRVSYSEDDGTCGPLADETVVFGGSGGGGDCTAETDISDDQCEATIEAYCTDGETYEQSLVWALTQTGEESISGIVTLMFEDAGFACRSTYDVDMRRQ